MPANRLAPAEARAVSIPEEILDNPEPFVEEVLEEWHASRPQYPTDPEEWARRASLVRQDPAYSILKQHHEDPSTPEEEKFRLSLQMAARRRGIMTAPKPEELIAAQRSRAVSSFWHSWFPSRCLDTIFRKLLHYLSATGAVWREKDQELMRATLVLCKISVKI